MTVIDIIGPLALVYFAPTAIALLRRHHAFASIAVVNTLLGWTFIGWVVALAWSVSTKRATA